ncbi:three-Cys-motif partner protein TcmP [Deferribacter abyssi]|uniref:three-Cys-motif partner protein TcmP n=1 Tax=Deferribacter abyssi TaxID=213806 RepID=UPI003C1CB512
MTPKFEQSNDGKKWIVEKHTAVKHELIKRYLSAWIKILGGFEKLYYVDCNAGNGVWKDAKTGELKDGSPIIAISTFIENLKYAKKDFNVFLVEKDKVNFNYLKNLVTNKFKDYLSRIHILNADVSDIIADIINETKQGAGFYFFDPYGFKEISYGFFTEIMKYKKHEILYNFMFNTINRFLSYENLKEKFYELFGGDNWREVINYYGKNREEKLMTVVRNNFKKIAKYVIPYKINFEDKQRTYYYLLHLSNHLKACSILKSTFGSFNYGRIEYLGERNNQVLISDLDEFRIPEIKETIINSIIPEKESIPYISILDKLIDSTPYQEADIMKALLELEQENIIRVYRVINEVKRKRTYIKDNDKIFKKKPALAIKRKSLLYESKVEYAGYTINHVEGCTHGCQYPCYAFMMKRRFGKVKNWHDWITPKIVENSLELLDKEIPKYKEKINKVHLCFTTDPFMYGYTEVIELTLKIIEKLNNYGIPVTTLTKGIYPDKIQFENFHSENEYGITLVSLNESFRQKYEPFSANYEDRINSLKKLSDKGCFTWVSIEPYPTPNIVKQDIKRILKKIDFVDNIIFGKLNYNVESNEFKYSDEFYKKIVNDLIEFCNKKGIKYHIKQGTPSKDVD